MLLLLLLLDEYLLLQFLKVDVAEPVLGGMCSLNAGIRKTGNGKIKIPKGPLTGFVAHWLNPNGCMRVFLDYALEFDGITKRLGHNDETTTKDRQVVVDGNSKISQRTKEADLDALAIDLLTRGFPATAAALGGNGDGILTYFGFRKPNASDATRRADFVDRLVALQLIIRRGIEIRADMDGAGTADDQFPLFATSADSYNSCDWDKTLATAEPPGTATKQKLDPAQQDAAALQRNGPAIRMDSLAEVPGPVDTTAMAAMMATIERLTKESARQHEEIQTMKRRRIDGPPGTTPAAPIEPAPPASFLPTHAIPNSVEPNTAPHLDDVGATAILNQPEIDPADSVDIEVVPEIVARCKAFTTVTAECIHGITCQVGQAAGFEMTQAADGTHKIVAATSSSRKIGSIWELHAVTGKLIASVSTVHPTVGLKMRAQLPDAVFRAHRNFKSNLSKTIMYWNRHVNQWIQGMKTGSNKSLKYSPGLATVVCEDYDMTRGEAADTDKTKAAFTDMRNEIKNLKRSLQSKQSGSGTSHRPTNTATTGPRTATRTDASSKQPCANHLAGRPCAILDKDDGKCIFDHAGDHGSDPEAAKTRFNKP